MPASAALRRLSCSFASATALLALLSPTAVPLGAQTPTFEQVLSLRQVGAAAISPDGRHVAFTHRTTEWTENRYDSEIWLARDGAAPTQWTRTARGNSGTLRWSPDGAWLGFVADRGEKVQVYVISLSGGEAFKVTAAKEGVNDFRWSPDGRWIAYVATEGESAAMKARKEKYGEFAVEDADFALTHLWLTPVAPSDWAAGKIPDATPLTSGTAFTVGNFAWSPDATQIAFDHAADPLANSWITQDISILTVSTQALRPLVRQRGSDGNPVWSPDGRHILYNSAAGDTTANYYKNGHLLRVPASGGAATRLAADFDEQIGGVTWNTRGIFFTGRAKTLSRLYRIDPERGSTAVAIDTPMNVTGASFSADGSRLVFFSQSATTLSEVFVSSLAPFAPTRVTAMSDQIATWSVGSADVVKWKSRDGAEIEGVLHKPRNFDPSKKYPLLVVIHGGPTGIDVPQPLPGSVYPIAQWIARGALVLRPNYRGSAGYGEAFRALNVKNLGVGDLWDVMSGVDHVIAQGIVDTSRMGSMGWSQGGYISAFLTTNTTRFKAISVGAGISNWVTYYVATDIHPFTKQYLKNDPWRDAAIYAKTSPMTNILKARTPTLIQHGEFDRRVPIQNAYELFQGLQDVGVPTQLVVYKGFGHGITKPKETMAALQHNWDWFEKYLFATP
ncbi:MAG: prolyl oligopeptidase family serine peptidase [Gemmatimonadaceae bacterium]